MLSRALRMLATAALVLAASAAPTHACSMACVIYGGYGTRGVLLDKDDGEGNQRPIANAKLLVRDASPSADGPEVYCGRKGRIVLQTSTDKYGNFRLKGLHPGKYFVTYMNPEYGQSFLVEIHRSNPFKPFKRFDLPMFNGDGGCYAVDIERNVTIPDWGGIKPIKDDHK
jgi:hypothetical protein